jgi:hypothetical protein
MNPDGTQDVMDMNIVIIQYEKEKNNGHAQIYKEDSIVLFLKA